MYNVRCDVKVYTEYKITLYRFLKILNISLIHIAIRSFFKYSSHASRDEKKSDMVICFTKIKVYLLECCF